MKKVGHDYKIIVRSFHIKTVKVQTAKTNINRSFTKVVSKGGVT